MKQSGKRQWTRGEKWLWAAPLIFLVGAGVAAWGPGVVRKQLGRPIVLETSPGNFLLRDIALSADGSILSTTGTAYSPRQNGGLIYFWNARTLEPLPTWNLGSSVSHVDAANAALALSPDGDSVAYAPWTTLSSNARFLLFDRSTKRIKWQLKGNFSQAQARFSPDGGAISVTRALAGGTNYLLLDVATGKALSEWANLKTPLYKSALAWAPDGKTVACVGGDHIETRRVADGAKLHSWSSPPTSLLNFSQDGKSLVTVTHKDEDIPGKSRFEVFVINPFTGQREWSYEDKRDMGFGLASYVISDAQFSPNGKTLLPSRLRLHRASTCSTLKAVCFNAPFKRHLVSVRALVLTQLLLGRPMANAFTRAAQMRFWSGI